MRITILTAGTRGDVQPYIALGCGLRSAGYEVRLATCGPFREMVEAHGLEFRFLAADPREEMRGRRGKKFLDSGESAWRFVLRMIPILRENLRRHLSDVEAACQGAVKLVKGGGPDNHQIGFPDPALVSEENGNQPHHGVHDGQGIGEDGQNPAAQHGIPEA